MPEPENVPWPRRAAHVVLALASLALAIWFIWDIIDGDSIPAAFDAISAVAAVIIVLDVCRRLWLTRGSK
jgi:hypothetical protein